MRPVELKLALCIWSNVTKGFALETIAKNGVGGNIAKKGEGNAELNGLLGDNGLMSEQAHRRSLPKLPKTAIGSQEYFGNGLYHYLWEQVTKSLQVSYI